MKKTEKWIFRPDYFHAGITVHEVRCPVCKVGETYIDDKIPNYCYVCEERREI